MPAFRTGPTPCLSPILILLLGYDLLLCRENRRGRQGMRPVLNTVMHYKSAKFVVVLVVALIESQGRFPPPCFLPFFPSFSLFSPLCPSSAWNSTVLQETEEERLEGEGKRKKERSKVSLCHLQWLSGAKKHVVIVRSWDFETYGEWHPQIAGNYV